MKKIIILIILGVFLTGAIVFNDRLQSILHSVFAQQEKLPIAESVNETSEVDQESQLMQEIETNSFSFSCPEGWYTGDNLKFNGKVKVKECSKEFSPGDMSFDDGMVVSFYFIPDTSMDGEKWQDYQTLSSDERSTSQKIYGFDGYQVNNRDAKEIHFLGYTQTKDGYIFVDVLHRGITMSVAEYEKTLNAIIRSFVDPTKITFTSMVPSNLLSTKTESSVVFDVDDVVYKVSIPLKELKLKPILMKNFDFIESFFTELLSLPKNSKIKEIKSEIKNPNIVENQTIYYLVFDVDPQLNTTKKYVYKDISATVTSQSKDILPFLNSKFCKQDVDCSMKPVVCGGLEAGNGYYASAGWPYECSPYTYHYEGVDADKVLTNICKFTNEDFNSNNISFGMEYDPPKCIKNTCTIQNPKAVCTSWK